MKMSPRKADAIERLFVGIDGCYWTWGFEARFSRAFYYANQDKLLFIFSILLEHQGADLWIAHPHPGYTKRGLRLRDYLKWALRNEVSDALPVACNALALDREKPMPLQLRAFRERSELEGFKNTVSGTCWYCLNEPANSRDHFYPKSRGGSDHAANLIPACMNCNRTKSNSLISVWVPKLVGMPS